MQAGHGDVQCKEAARKAAALAVAEWVRAGKPME